MASMKYVEISFGIKTNKVVIKSSAENTVSERADSECSQISRKKQPMDRYWRLRHMFRISFSCFDSRK